MIKHKKNRSLIVFAFIVYLIVLIWIIVFKMCISLEELVCARSINWIPFYYNQYVGFGFHLRDIMGNIIIFMPFGIFISLLRSEWSLFKKVAPVFCTSVAFEIIQFITGWGAADTTDVITNTVGGIMGIGLYILIKKFFGNHAKKGQ